MDTFYDAVLAEDLRLLSQAELPFHTWKNKTFFVTGATGLVGSLAVKALLYISDVHRLSLRIVAQIRNPEKAKRVLGSLLNRSDLTLLQADLAKDTINYAGPVDYVIHAAAVTTSKLLVSHPVEACKTAINGTLSVLDFAVSKQTKGAVYLSSMEVYGVIQDGRDVQENDLGYVDLTAVRSCYPEGKRMCECLCTAYAHQYQLPVSVVRLAQTFGAGVPADDNRVFAQFAKSVIHGNNIVLHTDGLSEGNYIYTTDALKAIFLLLDRGVPGEAYNAANEACHTTIVDMARLVADRIANKQIQVDICPPADLQAMGYAPKTKLRLVSQKLRDLGWQPVVDLEEAYRRLIKSLEVAMIHYE